MVPNRDWYRSGTLLSAAILNLKMLTLIFARHRLAQTTFLALSARSGNCRVSYSVQPGGARNLCDGTAGEFHELGGFANDEY